MYDLNLTAPFKRNYRKLMKNNKGLEARVQKALELLRQNPFYPALRNHKVLDKFGVESYSARVTGDIRILWDYSKSGPQILDILNLGGHSGTKKVYR